MVANCGGKRTTNAFQMIKLTIKKQPVKKITGKALIERAIRAMNEVVPGDELNF